jgi:hypothetical protein
MRRIDELEILGLTNSSSGYFMGGIEDSSKSLNSHNQDKHMVILLREE